VRLLYRIGRRLRSLVRPEPLDAELSEELCYHVDRQIAENIALGMTSADARRAALLDLGGIQQIKENCRETRRTQWLESSVQDVRFGIRTFLRRPAFTFSVLAIMALGIGSATVVFSIVNGVLLIPLPYRAPANLVRIFGAWEHGSTEGISPPDFADYRSQNTSFESMAGASIATPLLNLRGTGDPEQVRSRQITSDFFSTLGIRPMLGREFRAEDEIWKGPPVAILSYGLWQRQFGGNASVVGKPLRINGQSYTVVGVMPPFFNFLGSTDVFTPLQSNPVPGMRSARILIVIGRLRTDLRTAQIDLDALGRRLRAEQSQFDRGWSVVAAPLTNDIVKDVRAGLLMLLGAIGLAILLVSASIASMMLSHAASRQTEISVRLALGATRGRLVRQLLTESLLLAAVGGAVGCAVGYAGLELVKNFGPQNIPRLAEVSIDFRAFAFGLAVSVLIGIGVGLEPALRAGRAEIGEKLKSGGRTATTRQLGLREILIVAQVAVSAVLLIGAGLLLRSLVGLESVNPGFQPSNLVTTRIALPGSKYGDGGIGIKVTTFWHEALGRIDDIPGVESAALTSELPLSGLNNPSPRTATAPGGEPHHVYLRSVSPGYWNVMRIPLLAGRLLSTNDLRTTQRVVVINQQFRRDVFGDRDPIGQRLTFDFQQGLETENYQAIVVGVTGDVRHTSLASPPFREAYLPLDQAPLFNFDLVVRTTSDPKSVDGDLKKAIWSLDRDESVGALQTLNEVLDLNLAQPRFRAYVLGGFAAMALILSAAGLYGLLSFLVSQRNREIGIRLALGAMPANILQLVMGKGLGLTAVGMLLGLPVSFAVTCFISTLVYSISTADPLTFIAVASVLMLVAVLASYWPARRAMNLNPVDILRSE
jgi:putative ABC transport system permease protein